MTRPTPRTETPYMTILAGRWPREKVHTRRGHAHNAISAKVGLRGARYEYGRYIGGTPTLGTDAALYEWDGADWRLLWEGKRGDDVSGKPWASAPGVEKVDVREELQEVIWSVPGADGSGFGNDLTTEEADAIADAILAHFNLTPKGGAS